MTHKSIKRGSPHTVGHFIHLYIDGTLVVLLSAFGACWLAHSCMKQKEMYHLMQNQFVCSNSEHFFGPLSKTICVSFFSLFSFFPDCLPCSLHHSNCYVHMTDLIIGVMYFGLPPPQKKSTQAINWEVINMESIIFFCLWKESVLFFCMGCNELSQYFVWELYIQ